MSWIQAWLRALLEFCGLIPKPDLRIRRSDEQLAPTDIAGDEIVVIGPRRHPKWAVFHCPGACGVLYRLPLGGGASPQWRISTDWLGRPSAAPSVHQKSRCHAHFWVKAGAVIWCRDSGCRRVRDQVQINS